MNDDEMIQHLCSFMELGTYEEAVQKVYRSNGLYLQLVDLDRFLEEVEYSPGMKAAAKSMVETLKTAIAAESLTEKDFRLLHELQDTIGRIKAGAE